MVVQDPSAECFVCHKHQTRGPLMPGGPVGEDDLVVVSHLHVHLTPRYPGTPPEYWWEKVAQWPGAPRGLEPRIADLVRDLRAYLNSADCDPAT